MNPPPLAEEQLQQASTAEIHSALFTQLIAGHAQMAMMLLGKYPNPQTGENEPVNLEAAKMFIDQLEMLEAKTRGNLTSEETGLLRQMLTATQISFAEVIDAQVGENESGSKS